MFTAAYVHSKRTDLQWVLDGPEAHGFKGPVSYTSLADLDYVYTGVGFANYVWFQHQLERMQGFS